MADDTPFCPDALARKIFRITMLSSVVFVVAAIIAPMM